ncbi:hypothetical protein [Hoeflea sp. TYP-13]|uniref:hypothetical protein n=1 Tax=Hoeflea sp. TYP-13 TaxID=3230023 RepID=UPI0034C5C8FB
MYTSKMIAITSAALVLMGNFGMPSAAAQSATDCSCIIQSGADARSVGVIQSVVGQVLVSQADGFSQANAGTQLTPGSRMIVGPQSRALVNIGSGCEFGLVTENLDLSLEPQDGNICVRVTKAEPTPTTEPTEAQQTERNAKVAAVLAGVGAGAAVGLLTLAISD